MTAVVDPAPTPTRRARGWRWLVLGLVTIGAAAGLSGYLTAPRPGGELDPDATGPAGAHALVALLRDHGVQVVVAGTVADVENAARADALVLVAETARIADDEALRRLARIPGDLLLVRPVARARDALAPGIRTGRGHPLNHNPGCELRGATRAGSVDLGGTATYVGADARPITSCYAGALVRYRSGDRTITVVGSASFLTNAGLLSEGNAALAMNLAGARPRLIWYAPQRVEGKTAAPATIFELIPPNATWLVWQLCLALALAALWKGRRLGPLVAEQLPVVVRASETIEGLGRLYRSRRARDRAGHALRVAALQRLSPRLGLGPAAAPPAVVAAVSQRTGAHPDWLGQLLFGPPPASDADLVQLARALDDIERQVTHP